MTRQKSEIIKKINSIREWIAVDEELGCGFAPADFYEPLYRQIYELEEQLARLRKYDSVEAMYFDEKRLNSQKEELPFN